jgi:hypothetical protein
MKSLDLGQDEPWTAAPQDHRGDDHVQSIQVARLQKTGHRDAAALDEQPQDTPLSQLTEKIR